MSAHNSVFDEVERFIDRFHNRDSIVTARAAKFTLTMRTKGKLGLTSEEQKNYADILGWAIGAYQLHKDSAPFRDRLEMAYTLLDYIERGRTYGVIKDNVKMADRLKECQDENKQLKETKIQLEAKILKLKAENEELHKVMDKLGGKRTSTLEPKD